MGLFALPAVTRPSFACLRVTKSLPTLGDATAPVRMLWCCVLLP